MQYLYRLSSLFALTFVLSTGLFAQKRVLLEKYTSAFCGNCPNGHVIANDLKATYPELILVFHHSSVDGMGNPFSTEWRDSFNVLGTPYAMVDRFGMNPFNIAVNPVQWDGRIQDQLDEPAVVDLEIEGEYTVAHRRLDLNISARFSSLPEGDDLRLNVMIVEDSLTGSGFGWDQSNYYNESPGHPLEGLGQPIYNYHHNNVLREVLDGPWGTADVFPSNPELNVPYNHSYTYYLPIDYKAENSRVVVFVSNYDLDDILNRKILNANEVSLIGPSIVTDTEEELAAASPAVFLYPNPAKDRFWVDSELLAKGIESMELLDQTGRNLLYLQNWNNDDGVDISDLSPGAYYVRLQLRDGVVMEKVVVTR